MEERRWEVLSPHSFAEVVGQVKQFEIPSILPMEVWEFDPQGSRMGKL